MLIHNKLEIKKGGKTFVSFNSLLSPALNAIHDFKPYSKFIAIGVGGDETSMTDTSLHSWQKTLPLITESVNFDPRNGQLFITKKLVLDEADKQALEIVEIGLTGDGESENPQVANRFLANGGEPIYRDPMEEMTFEITIYLELDNSSSLALTGGSNPLVKLLLGDGVIEEGEPKFVVAKGFDETANGAIVQRTLEGLNVFDATLNKVFDDKNMVVSLNLVADVGEGEIRELLIAFNGEVVARQNVLEVSGVVDGEVFSVVADKDNMATMPISGVNAVTKVANLSNQNEITDYSISYFGTSFVGSLTELFVGYDIDETSEMVVARSGEKLSFFKDGKCLVFDFSSGECVAIDSSAVDASKTCMKLIYEDYIYLKNDLGNAVYSVTTYWLNGDKYKSVTFYPTSGLNEIADKSKYWVDMDIVRMDEANDNKLCLLVACNNQLIHGYRLYNDRNHHVLSDGVLGCTLYKPKYIKAMPETNRQTFSFMTYDLVYNRVGYLRGTTYYNSTDAKVLDIALNYVDAGYPKFGKNYIYAFDESTSTIKAFNFEDNTIKNKVFSNISKIWHDDNLNYIATKTSEGIKLYYVDGSLNTYEFSSMLPSVDGEVEDIVFVADFVIVRTTDSRFFGIKINKNKFIVNGIEKGTAVQITYAMDKTPGINGGNVVVNAKLSVSV